MVTIPSILTGKTITQTTPYLVNYASFYLKWGEVPIIKNVGTYGEQVRTTPISELPEKTITCNGETRVIPYNLKAQLLEFFFDPSYTIEFSFDGDYVEDILLLEVVSGTVGIENIDIDSTTPGLLLTAPEPIINPIGSVEYNFTDGTLGQLVAMQGTPTIVNDSGTNVLELNNASVRIEDDNIYTKWEVKYKDLEVNSFYFDFTSNNDTNCVYELGYYPTSFRIFGTCYLSYTETGRYSVSGMGYPDGEYHILTVTKSEDNEFVVKMDGTTIITITLDDYEYVSKTILLYSFNVLGSTSGVYVEYIKAWQEGYG